MRRLLDEQPGDVVEPEVRAAEEAAGPAQVEPVEQSGPRGAGAAGGCAGGWPGPGCPGAGSTPWCRCGAAASRRGSPGRAGGRSAGRPARGSRTGTGRPAVAPAASSLPGRDRVSAIAIVGGAEEQLGVDHALGQELGVLLAAAGLEVLGLGGELGLDDPLAEVGRLVGDLAEPGAQRPEAQADHAQDDHRPAQQVLELVDERLGTARGTARPGRSGTARGRPSRARAAAWPGCGWR